MGWFGVVVIGAGNSGAEAARVAARLGCGVSVLSRGRARLVEVERSLAHEGLRVNVAQIDDQESLEDVVAIADLVIGAVLEPGSLSPKLITRRTLKRMRRGSAIVDIGIDQGGICETSRMTTLSHPMYVEEGIVHYAVPNMPALVARTATLALSGATLPYVRKLADEGIEAALDDDPGLARGVMVWEGVVVHAGLAADSGKTAVARAWGESARRPVV